MEIRVTGKSGGKVVVQDVSGRLRDTRFSQTGTWVNFKGARCERVDFSRMEFSPFNALGSEFIDCSFERVKFKSHGFGDAKSGEALFRSCRFDKADLRGLGRDETARFEHCSFAGTKIDHWQADEAEFIDCVFSGKMHDVRFSGRPWHVEYYRAHNRELHDRLAPKYGFKSPYSELARKANEFRGNDFREADLDYVSFEYGIDVDAQMLPTGPQYLRLDRIPERIERARAVVSRWTDDKLREHALFELRRFSTDGYAEQRVIFINRFSAPSADFRDRSQPVFDLLERILD